MRDILRQLRDWWETGRPIGLATVIDVRGSAPRQPGAAMGVLADGEVLGSVSGGCVEGAVFEVAQNVLATGVARKVTYGISDEEAFGVGLTCGGEIDVFVERLDARNTPFFGEFARAVIAEEPVAAATVIDGPNRVGAKLLVGLEGTSGSLGSPTLEVAVTADARAMLTRGQTGQRRYGADGERRRDDVSVFVSSFASRPRMLVFGAIDFAAAVASIGGFLGYHVTVCDARAPFASPKRFPDADEVVVEWPHRFLERITVDARTVICVLTHDPKFDVPLLEVALRTEARYVWAMGSRRTHEDRLVSLRKRGLDEELLARLRSPIGLDLGARTPEETAVSVAAEIIQQLWHGSGQPLSDTIGPIHRQPLTNNERLDDKGKARRWSVSTSP